MEVNVVAVIVATVAMFAVSAFWYMVPFGKLWGKMHGFEKLSKKEQQAMQSKMGPYYALQALVTLISAWVLAYFLAVVPGTTWSAMAFLLWLGFIVPTEFSAVIFGGTEGKWIAKKIAVSAGGSLVSLLVGAWVISLF